MVLVPRHTFTSMVVSIHTTTFSGEVNAQMRFKRSHLRVGMSLLLWLSATEVCLGRIALQIKTEEWLPSIKKDCQVNCQDILRSLEAVDEHCSPPVTVVLARWCYPTYSQWNNCLSASNIRTTSSQFAYGKRMVSTQPRPQSAGFVSSGELVRITSTRNTPDLNLIWRQQLRFMCRQSPLKTCRNVIENFTIHVDTCCVRGDAHIEQLYYNGINASWVSFLHDLFFIFRLNLFVLLLNAFCS